MTASLTVTDAENQALPASAVEVAVSNSTQLLYTGSLSAGSVSNLPPGVYSFYAQNLLVGFNATVVSLVSQPTSINLKLSPYTSDYLLDTRTDRSYYRPTDPALVLRVVFGVSYPALKGGASCFSHRARSPPARVTEAPVSTGVNSPRTTGTLGRCASATFKLFDPSNPRLKRRGFGKPINQSDTLPPVNLLRPSSASSSGSICPPPYWGLYKTVNLGVVNMLQGAVYSWGKNASDQVQNTPTPSQYSAVYSEVSINGGPLSQSSATLHSVTTTEQLPMASTFNPNGPENYDVNMQGTWYDYIYHQYEWGFFNGHVKEVFEMGQSGNWYKYDNWATSTSDYSFSYFENSAIGDKNQNTIYMTLSQVGTQSQSFGVEATLSVGSSSTGGEFSGSFNIAGYSSLNSQTTGTTVVYQLTGYDYCGGFYLYRSGWVLGFSQGFKSC